MNAAQVLYRVNLKDKEQPIDQLRFSAGSETFKVKPVTKMKRLWEAWMRTPTCVPPSVAAALQADDNNWRKLLVFTLNGRTISEDDTPQTLGLEDKAIIHVSSLRSTPKLLPHEAAPLEVVNDICRIQDNAEFHDVHFLVGQEEEVISANRTILAARSERFFAMLRPGSQRESQMEEARTGEVAVPDQTPGAFRAMLKYMYSGDIDVEGEISQLIELLCVAHYYVIGPLKRILEAAALKRMSKDNVAELLRASDLYDCETLKRSSQEFIADNFADLKSSLATTLAENPELLMEIAAHIHESPAKRRRITVVE